MELQDARLLSRALLEEYLTLGSTDDDILMWPNLRNMIEYELDTPWIARMDHLDHRKWIEESKASPLYLGKASFYRWDEWWPWSEWIHRGKSVSSAYKICPFAWLCYEW
ncbi:hypothetical protein Ancab_005271 [Ancistrocladus abbreviatus]